jgi:hypothetical protein
MLLQGCDASVMLVAPSGDDESHSGDDATLSPEAVNKAKAAVEALPGCAGKVSCADILAMAARDVVSLVINQTLLPILFTPQYTSRTRTMVMVRKEGYGAMYVVE